MSNLIKVDNVSKVFGEGMFSRTQTVAVKDVSLTVPQKNPKIIAIAGESGSGKTTMARLILGMVSATRGSILFQEKDRLLDKNEICKIIKVMSELGVSKIRFTGSNIYKTYGY